MPSMLGGEKLQVQQHIIPTQHLLCNLMSTFKQNELLTQITRLPKDVCFTSPLESYFNSELGRQSSNSIPKPNGTSDNHRNKLMRPKKL